MRGRVQQEARNREEERKRKEEIKKDREKIKKEKGRDKNKLAEMKKDGENKSVLDKIKCLLTDKISQNLIQAKTGE